jgi:ectoine hydroxylase-related dioxygenase (phytanoyl-CoA dioxygenase family)
MEEATTPTSKAIEPLLPPPPPYRQKTFCVDDAEAVAAAIEEDGFALIRGVLSPPECLQLREAIARLRDDPQGLDRVGRFTDMFKCVFNRDPAFLALIDRAGVVDIADRLMGPDCHVIGETAWRSGPGHDGWRPHTDRVFFEMPEDMLEDPRFTPPVCVCTAHYYLDDVTPDLAPTWVLPGSHRSGRALAWGEDSDPRWRGRALEPVLCREGDVLLFRSEVWHSGSRNATADRDRRMVQVHYARRWVAQHFTPYLSFRFAPWVLEEATPRQRRLLGEHARAEYD